MRVTQGIHPQLRVTLSLMGELAWGWPSVARARWPAQPGVKAIGRKARARYSNAVGQVSRVASLASPGLGTAIGSFYMRLYPTKVPIRVFLDEEEALRWLREGLQDP